MLGRSTISTYGPGENITLDPSTQATAFTRSNEIKRETIDVKNEGRAEFKVEPLTKVEVVPSDNTAYPKHIYINISSQNVNTSQGIPAQFQLDFDQPYLRNTEKYYLTIAKATFPTSSIPLFTFALNQDSLLPSGHDTSLNQFVVQMTSSASAFGYASTLRPVNINTTVGPFNVYAYQQFIDSVNLGLLQTFCQLAVNDSNFAGTVAPFYTYDGSSLKFKFIAQKNVWTPEKSTLDHGATVSLNYATSRLFNGIPGTNTIAGNLLFIQNIVESQSGYNEYSTSQGVNPILSGAMTNLTGGLNSAWNATFEYAPGAIVVYNGNYYGSLVNLNINYQPDISGSQWQLICATSLDSGRAATVYNAAASYVQYQLVYYPTINSNPYISLVSANTGNTPVSSPGQWKSLAGSGNPTVFNPSATYVVGQNVYYPNSQSTIYTNLSGTAGTNPSTDTTNWKVSTVFDSNIIVAANSSLANWSDIESIVIQTGTLPVRYEIFTPPQSDSGDIVSSAQNPRPVLTDIDVLLGPEGFDRTPLKYIPSGPYRMIDLMAREELRRIDAYLQYKHKDLSFTDLIMLPGEFFSIKFLFVRNDAFTLG